MPLLKSSGAAPKLPPVPPAYEPVKFDTFIWGRVVQSSPRNTRANHHQKGH